MRTRWILLIALFLIFIHLMNTECFGINYVCIDPGHGGSDSGAVGGVYHYAEKTVNIEEEVR